jgi:hypothetical protein
MGVCCCSSKLISGENYIRRTIQQISLWDTTYNELKEELLKYSNKQAIKKREILNSIYLFERVVWLKEQRLSSSSRKEHKIKECIFDCSSFSSSKTDN